MGLRGQLAHGPYRKFVIAPEKVASSGGFLSAPNVGYAHNVGIMVKRKYLNDKLLTEVLARERDVGEETFEGDARSGPASVYGPDRLWSKDRKAFGPANILGQQVLYNAVYRHRYQY